MGKHGPCYHCGVTSTPLWRNGPPEKPILCNACGSRWRTKGSLVNYSPLHSRAEHEQYKEYKVPRPNILSIKHKEPKVLKRKPNHENKLSVGTSQDYEYVSTKAIDKHTSNRSSSGSAISNFSESGLHYGTVDTSELTGPSQSVMWNQTVPSRKRTCLNRPKQTQLEKLTKDLYTILHEQQSSHFSLSSEADLLFYSDEPMVSVEIGHGSVLIRHPNSIEEESEASSISVENKAHLVDNYYSRSPSSPLYVSNIEIENNEKPSGQGIQKEQVNNRDKHAHDKLWILENHNSPLCDLDLKEIINYEVYISHMTNEEQYQLLQFLPHLDTATLPDSLQSMFADPRFEESLDSFKKLLSEGFFEVKTEECARLKKLAFSNFQKSTWVEQYSSLKEKEAKRSKKGSVSQEGDTLLAYGTSTSVKKSRDDHFRIGSGTKTMMKKNSNLFNLAKNASSFSPRRSLLFNVNTFQHMNENLEQDLLLDVPNNIFLPEAELFYH